MHILLWVLEPSSLRLLFKICKHDRLRSAVIICSLSAWDNGQNTAAYCAWSNVTKQNFKASRQGTTICHRNPQTVKEPPFTGPVFMGAAPAEHNMII